MAIMKVCLPLGLTVDIGVGGIPEYATLEKTLKPDDDGVQIDLCFRLCTHVVGVPVLL